MLKKRNTSTSLAPLTLNVVVYGAVKNDKKIESGMSYFITQPVYSKENTIQIYDATKHLTNHFS